LNPTGVDAASAIGWPENGGDFRMQRQKHVLENHLNPLPKAGTLLSHFRRKSRLFSGQPAVLEAPTASRIRASDLGRRNEHNRSSSPILIGSPKSVLVAHLGLANVTLLLN